MKTEETEDMSLADAAKVNVARAGVYSLLSKVFKLEVDDSFIETLIEMEAPLRLLSESQGGKKLKEGVSLLLNSAKRLSETKGEERKKALTDLAAEYANLFLSFGPKPVHLVESVYLGKDHLLYEEPYHEIVVAYRTLGFKKEKGFLEPEDHISVEFEFMAALCKWTTMTLEKNEVKNAIQYSKLQKEFLNDHIMKWVPELCKKLEEAASSDFYKSIAALTLGFITLDNEMPDHLREIMK